MQDALGEFVGQAACTLATCSAATPALIAFVCHPLPTSMHGSVAFRVCSSFSSHMKTPDASPRHSRGTRREAWAGGAALRVARLAPRDASPFGYLLALSGRRVPGSAFLALDEFRRTKGFWILLQRIKVWVTGRGGFEDVWGHTRFIPCPGCQRDRYFIAGQPAPAPHLAHQKGCATLRIVLVTVPRVSRSCEHSPEGFDLNLLPLNFKMGRTGLLDCCHEMFRRAGKPPTT